MRTAIVREISSAMDRCELTHLAREPIDLGIARAQHREYEACLATLGCTIIRLPAEPDLPDSVFVEDAAIVLDELAVITRPGAASRRAESSSIAEASRAYRELQVIQPPGTLDGGDVLRFGQTLYVGHSSRTNRAGIRQLTDMVTPFGYGVEVVAVAACLHLKSAATPVTENALLVNRDWIDSTVFKNVELIDVDPSEPFAANALLIEDTVVYSKSFEATCMRLQSRGLTVTTVDTSELAKAEGGVTCCSLVFRHRRPR